MVVQMQRDNQLQASRVRVVPIPYRCMGMLPVRMLEAYLWDVRLPSGGSLLGDPKGELSFELLVMQLAVRRFKGRTCDA